MSLFAGPEEHAANPPATWTVSRVTRSLYALRTKDGTVLATYHRRGDAIQDRRFSELYDKEARWYAGEPVPGWKPYALVLRSKAS
jgi:hypothetical protein